MHSESFPLTKIERLQRLLEISRLLSSTLELPRLLQLIVELATEVTASETASILLYDIDSGQLKFAFTPSFQGDSLKQLNVPLDESAAGWSFSNRRPLIIQDAPEDPRVFRQIDQTIDFETRSLLIVPLMIKDVPIGVVEAVNKLDQGNYNEDDQELLETLAAQAAIAIENARLMRELKTANVELQRLVRMKSDFIAITSHELRTPLGLILGHAAYLEETAPEDCREQVDAITTSAMRLKSIIEDLSSMTQDESDETSLRRTEFSMSDLAREVAERFRKVAAEKQIDLRTKLPEKGSLKIDADREKLKVALSHIVRNAISFTDPKGRVGILGEGINGFVKISVKDSGIGIPKEDVQRVFDRFYQVESHLTRKHGGMGLGLSIAKAMVELHNGQIWCESEEGAGSTFVLLIPRKAKQADAASRVFKTG
jgi:signal transduction histidine kinase